MDSKLDEQEKAKRRRYHRDRAIVAKIAAEPSPAPTDRMSDEQLVLLCLKLVDDMHAFVRTTGHVQLARQVRDLRAAELERYLRGQQLALQV